MMVFKGLQKVSLIDYPHKICAVVFTGGCNFRCHYCHNPELVLDYEKLPDIPDSQIITLLESRKGFIDALCISGGEPTLHRELPEFIAQVKTMGFLVKLDTNGTNPAMLKALLEKKLVDYIAMDIKTVPEKYSKVVGVETDISKISESIKAIMISGIDYEFRTTVFPEFFTVEDAKEINRWLVGADQCVCPQIRSPIRYVLQKPRTDKTLDPSFRKAKLYPDSELLALAKLIPNCVVR